MKNLTGRQILMLPMQRNDADAKTIGEYLVKLGAEVWREGEGFSGKRPFGNSCWETEIFEALVRAGAIAGRLDGDGYLEDSDDPAGRVCIDKAFASLYATVLPDDSEDITITVTKSASGTLTINRKVYEEAKGRHRLDHLLDAWISDLDEEITITEPDGTESQL